MVRISRSDIESLVSRARRLAGSGRRILGIAGAPGAGKSVLAAQVVEALAPHAVLVPMDGFHLAQVELARLGRAERKGAPDTFDADGYIALLRRLRADSEPIIYAPMFRRDLEEPIACAIPVPAEAPLVVTEGNYLLLDGPWAPLRKLLDDVWFLDLDDTVRLDRLIKRHLAFGRDREAAVAWANGSDQRNAELVTASRDRADVIVLGS